MVPEAPPEATEHGLAPAGIAVYVLGPGEPMAMYRWQLCKWSREKRCRLQGFRKPSSGLEPETPSLPWRCSTN
jgi:hypothetical protein